MRLTVDDEPSNPLCPLCEFDIDHRHHNGYPPVVSCRSCFVGIHWACDPATYWCACQHTDCLPREG